MTWLTAFDRVAATVHALHGTRGINAAAMGLLVWVIAEPGLPSGFSSAWAVLPLFALLLNGLMTLPREAVAVGERGRKLAESDDALRVLQKRALWLLALLIAMLPGFFLAAYGIPHLSPLAGLAQPVVVQRIAVAYLALILLLASQYVRSSRKEAPSVVSKRPIELRDGSGKHLTRQGWQFGLIVLVTVWLVLLRPYWYPFSLFQWPPSLESLASARSTASLTFAFLPPSLMMVSAAGHFEFLWAIHAQGAWRARAKEAALCAIMAAATLTIAGLHARNLLWVARYQAAGVL